MESADNLATLRGEQPTIPRPVPHLMLDKNSWCPQRESSSLYTEEGRLCRHLSFGVSPVAWFFVAAEGGGRLKFPSRLPE